MPTEFGIQAWIEVDGLPLVEYESERADLKMTCYIASQEGKKFTVRFRNVGHTMVGLRGNIYLDGICAGAGVLLPTDTHATSISGQTRLEGLESPFIFSRLKTTDDETEACHDERRLRDLGTIRIQLEWVNILRQEMWRPASNALSDSIRQPIYERSKKASSHCASLGEIEFARPKNWYTTTRIPGLDNVEFIFQYAPLEWLKAEGIAPTPSSSTVFSSNGKKRRQSTVQNDNSDLELLDPEEVTVYRRLKEKMANRNPAKKAKTVKQEPRASSLRPKGPPEVIDLTGDD